MTTLVAIWLGVLAAVVVLFVAVVRHVSKLVVRTRELEGFQHLIAEVDAATTAVVDPVLGALDGLVRHQTGDAGQVAGLLPHAAAALRETAERARKIEAPTGLNAEAARIVRELERAARAADLAARGIASQLDAGRDRRGESTIDLKRGALNLRHARDMVRTEASRIAAMTPDRLMVRRDSPWVRAQTAPEIYVAEGTENDEDDAFDPRM